MSCSVGSSAKRVSAQFVIFQAVTFQVKINCQEISNVNLRYACFKQPDWLLTEFQPMRKLETSVA